MVDVAVASYVHRLGAALRRVDGINVVGTYLHGSAAHGGFVPGRSDVDVLFVVADGPSASGETIGHALADAADGCVGRGLEASVVTRAQAATLGPPWRFVVHVTTEPPATRVVDGARHRGDDDLLMHYAMTVAAGCAVSGPSAGDVFAVASRREILEYLDDELESSLDGPTAYAVLNACRAWHYTVDGTLESKTAGAEWALSHDGPRRVIADALDQQFGRCDVTMLAAEAVDFVEWVRGRIGAAATTIGSPAPPSLRPPGRA